MAIVTYECFDQPTSAKLPMLHRYFHYLTHPRSEKLEEDGLSICGSIVVFGGELQGGRSGGSRKGKEEDGLFHHGCFLQLFVGFFVWLV